jgi:predicted alpha/beta hydrolase family esterase
MLETQTNRATEVLEAAETLMTVFHGWDGSDAEHFTRSLEDAFTAACGVFCADGGIPATIRHMEDPALALAESWLLVLDGRGVDSNGRPLDAFFQLVNELDVAVERTRQQLIAPKRLEPVAELLEQFGDDPRRWDWVAVAYGTQDSRGKWSGPFYDRFGTVQVDLVKKEAKTPGSVVKDPEALTPAAKRASETSSHRAKMAEIGRLIKLRSGIEDTRMESATIESQLREGQYPDVIARGHGVSVDEVLRVAETIGIDPANREADQVYIPPDPRGDAAAAAAEGTSVVAAPDRIETDEPVVKTLTKIEGDDLLEFVLAMAANDEKLNAPEIAQELAKAGLQASLSEIGEILQGVQ